MLAAKASPPVSDEQLQTFTSSLATLSKYLSDSTGSLPSYDRRQYELQIKGLEGLLEELRTLQPKAKFSFKRKPAATNSLDNSRARTQPASDSTCSTTYKAHETRFNLIAQENKYLGWGDFPVMVDTIVDRDVVMADLTSCIIDLVSPSTAQLRSGGTRPKVKAVHVRNLKNCVLMLPDIEGSILLHDLYRCTISVGCHQFRMHASRMVDVYISISSNPIIETSQYIRFARCDPLDEKSLSRQVIDNSLSVQDFSHIRASPSPNWSILPEHARLQNWPTQGMHGVGIQDDLQKLLPCE